MAQGAPPKRISRALLRRWPLPLLDAKGDKEARGTALVVAGSAEMPGAAILAGVAALRIGAGRLVVAVPADVAIAIAPHLPEARVVALPTSPDGGLVASAGKRVVAMLAQTADALLVGPGMVGSDTLTPIIAFLAARLPTMPLALDAAALATAPRRIDGAKSGVTRAVLTPHAGEMARMLGVERAAVERSPLEFALRAARDYEAVVVLKAGTSVIAHPRGTVWVHEGHTVGLGTSGSGDVLAGLITGLLARGAAPEQAAVWGVATHGYAGRALARRVGDVGFLAREIAGEVPTILRDLTGRKSARSGAK